MKYYSQFITEADQPDLLDRLMNDPEGGDITKQAVEASRKANETNSKLDHSVAEGKHRAASFQHRKEGRLALADAHREQAEIHFAPNKPKRKPAKNISRAQYRQGRR